jgi:hypothetical protein
MNALLSFLDTTLADAQTEAANVDWSHMDGINKSSWDEIFSRLDVDGNNVISSEEVARASMFEASSTCKKLNITRNDIREALAVLVEVMPKLTPYMVKNSQVMVYSAWTGQKPPPGTPEPSQDDWEVAVNESALVGESTDQLTKCQGALISTIFPAVGILLSITGIRLPTDAGEELAQKIAFKIGKNYKLLKKLKTVYKFADPGKIESSKITAVKFVKRVAKELWDSGVLKEAFTEVLRDLSWWEWTTIAVPALGSLAGFVVTGGASGTINIAIGAATFAIELGDLMFAVRLVRTRCRNEALLELPAGKSALAMLQNEFGEDDDLSWTALDFETGKLSWTA